MKELLQECRIWKRRMARWSEANYVGMDQVPGRLAWVNHCTQWNHCNHCDQPGCQPTSHKETHKETTIRMATHFLPPSIPC